MCIIPFFVIISSSPTFFIMHTFQELVAKLSAFWSKQDCLICTPYDLEKGAGTFNPTTFLRCLGPEPFRAAYIEPCRRPKDGRYASNPLRMQYYFQYQVILKPPPYNIQDLYLESLEAIGFVLHDYDLRFVHDDWEQPTLGAWGLGWEVWLDGLESSQFTYFQSVAGIPVKPITGELTYGLERLAMRLQNVSSVWDIQYNDHLTYGDLYRQSEFEGSRYNFEESDQKIYFRHFEDYKKEALRLCTLKLPRPAYDFVIKASHVFNLLDTRGVISVSERASYIASIRDLAKAVAECYLQIEEKRGFPCLHKWPEVISKPQFINVEEDQILTVSTDGESRDFLLEIGCEELPASFVHIGYQSLERQIKTLLDSNGLKYSHIETMGTPRRLAIIVHSLTASLPEQIIEKKGPSLEQAFDNSQLTAIGGGFLRSCGIPAITREELDSGKESRLEIRTVKGISHLFAILKKEKIETSVLLRQELSRIILSIDFPKKMRWADLDIAFARPIRWLVALFGNAIIPFSIGPIRSGRTTKGHRQLAPGLCPIPDASSYKTLLKKQMVIVDVQERLHEIEKQLEAIEKETHSCALKRQRVRQEVLHLVEWPFLTVATFDPTYLQAPQEVLVSEMVDHQKYFPLADASGNLKNSFIITANVPPTDSIRRGNCITLSARLTDGLFLFEQDKKKRLEEFNEELKCVLFQKGLGTLHDKVCRLRAHVGLLSHIPHANRTFLDEAATFCKADLVSEMVGEFEELQGQMGRIYASLEGKPQEVAQAIDEHWMPRGEHAPLPTTLTGALLSIADKIDTLIGFFGLGMKPTSSSDPYALRRQALGIVRIILEYKLQLPLIPLLTGCLKVFPKEIQAKGNELTIEVLSFIIARTRGIFQEMGFSKDEIEMCLACREDDLYDQLCRLHTLQQFRKTGNFNRLIEVHKRSYGQINGLPSILPLKPELFCEHDEHTLWNAMQAMEKPFLQAVEEQKYPLAFDLLISLQAPLASLFNNIKILSDDALLKTNRLALLQRVASLFLQIGDFQKLQLR